MLDWTIYEQAKDYARSLAGSYGDDLIQDAYIAHRETTGRELFEENEPTVMRVVRGTFDKHRARYRAERTVPFTPNVYRIVDEPQEDVRLRWFEIYPHINPN